MNPVLTRLVALLDILKSENSALEQAHIPEALTLLPQKEAAAKALTEAVAESEPKTTTGESPYQHLIEQFSALSTRNGELLQRAIAAQKRVVELLTAPSAHAEPQGYGQKGHYASSANTSNTPLFISNA